MPDKLTRAPVIETARLVLRPFRADDVDAQTAMMADPAVVRHLGGQPFAREDSWRKLVAGHAMWDLFGFGYWAVTRRGGDAMIGQIGFADFKRAMTPSIEGLPEMGWVFTAETSGQGHGSEAVAAALDWADRTLGGREIVAIIDEGNAPSIRLAEKCGFAEREQALYRDEPILLFRRKGRAA
jgi:RimJ/RimL family protein N-acetyltransferase